MIRVLKEGLAMFIAYAANSHSHVIKVIDVNYLPHQRQDIALDNLQRSNEIVITADDPIDALLLAVAQVDGFEAGELFYDHIPLDEWEEMPRPPC
jgi:hypothetical protein